MNKALLFLATLFSLQVHAQDLSLNTLKCEYQDSPMGVEELQPRLSWMMNSTQRNVKQVAYRVLVSEQVSKLAQNIGEVWDSKKVMNAFNPVPKPISKSVHTSSVCWKKAPSG